MCYDDPAPLSREEAEQRFASANGYGLSATLVSIALHGSDWHWVQSICLRFAHHPDAGVRSTAALCFGHLARIHRMLDLDVVLPTLRELASGPETRGQANNALDDIEVYLGKKIER